MLINAGAVNFSASHQFHRQQSQTTVALERKLAPGPEPRDPTPPAVARPTATPQQPPVFSAEPGRPESSDDELPSTDSELLLLKALVEALTGKHFDTDFPVGKVAGEDGESSQAAPSPNDPPPVDEDSARYQTLLFSHYEMSEYEYSNVDISGDFRLTGDSGEEQYLHIELSVTMARYYEESQTSLSVREGRLSDPLVINFNGQPVTLDATRTEFDLNSDGILDSLPTLSPDSAYLALDRDEDGLITRGAELFGPQTGSGFTELARFDEDGNGFIDQGDSIFQQLQVYRPGDGYLAPLASLGIAALYTGSINSPFQLNDSDNTNLGVVKSTGFFIAEDGSAGSIQQVDLRV